MARLMILTGKHEGRKIDLPDSAKLIVGRDEGVAIRIASNEVSRRHCAIRIRNGEISVTDLGSRNGTLVNEMPIGGQTTLTHGDVIRVGPLMMKLDAPELQTAAEAPGAVQHADTGGHALDEDNIANWLAEDEPEAEDGSTIIASSPIEGPSSVNVTPPTQPGSTPELVVQTTPPADEPPEQRSVVEEAQDIIRRHLELKAAGT